MKTLDHQKYKQYFTTQEFKILDDALMAFKKDHKNAIDEVYNLFKPYLKFVEKQNWREIRNSSSDNSTHADVLIIDRDEVRGAILEVFIKTLDTVKRRDLNASGFRAEIERYSQRAVKAILKTKLKTQQALYSQQSPQSIKSPVDIILWQEFTSFLNNGIEQTRVANAKEILLEGLYNGKMPSEIAPQFDRTANTIRIWENKVLRRLRHPQNSIQQYLAENSATEMTR